MTLMRARVSLVFHTHQSDLCADEDVRHPGGRTSTSQRNIEEGLSDASRLAPRCAWLVCALAAECENAHRAPPISDSEPLAECGNTQSASSTYERAVERDAPDYVNIIHLTF